MNRHLSLFNGICLLMDRTAKRLCEQNNHPTAKSMQMMIENFMRMRRCRQTCVTWVSDLQTWAAWETRKITDADASIVFVTDKKPLQPFLSMCDDDASPSTPYVCSVCHVQPPLIHWPCLMRIMLMLKAMKMRMLNMTRALTYYTHDNDALWCIMMPNLMIPYSSELWDWNTSLWNDAARLKGYSVSLLPSNSLWLLWFNRRGRWQNWS